MKGVFLNSHDEGVVWSTAPWCIFTSAQLTKCYSKRLTHSRCVARGFLTLKVNISNRTIILHPKILQICFIRIMYLCSLNHFQQQPDNQSGSNLRSQILTEILLNPDQWMKSCYSCPHLTTAYQKTTEKQKWVSYVFNDWMNVECLAAWKDFYCSTLTHWLENHMHMQVCHTKMQKLS